MERTRPKLDVVKTEKKNGEIQLVLKPITYLPTISVLTITKDRNHLFSLPVHNWKNFRYPEDKIEWVIVDDGKSESLRGLLPEDSRIHYHHLNNPLPIADKRNYAVKKCKGEIIVHMDDDDYHFPDSILAKARVLTDYPHDCVCSVPVGIHDLYKDKSVVADSLGDDIAEATFAYRKTFWKKQKFRSEGEKSEWFGFCSGRWKQMINLPFLFNIIMLTHSKNATGRLRRLQSIPNNIPTFYRIWDIETKKIIKSLVKAVEKVEKVEKGRKC